LVDIDKWSERNDKTYGIYLVLLVQGCMSLYIEVYGRHNHESNWLYKVSEMAQMLMCTLCTFGPMRRASPYTHALQCNLNIAQHHE